MLYLCKENDCAVCDLFRAARRLYDCLTIFENTSRKYENDHLIKFSYGIQFYKDYIAGIPKQLHCNLAEETLKKAFNLEEIKK